MSGNPQVFGLLEEILDSGKTPEEVCRDCPELMPEVRQRWQDFQLIDAQLRTFLPGLATHRDAGATAPAATVLPQVPGYEVDAVLGQGGMGVVYKARHLALKRTIALKMLAAGHSHPIERARFRTEAEAVAQLQHPNIVQIYEIGEAEGRPFFALEYVAGGSLAERLAGQPLPPRDAARLVGTLAEAMHLAHSRNLVHRDLKPGNVLLAGDADTPVGQCQPKVTDFGLVRQLDADSTQTVYGVVMGTPSYMAPEQAEGRAHAAGPAADVYALGAILYECMTGRPPFEGATPLETLMQVRNSEPAAPSTLNRLIPRDLETICLKCLRKQPEQRYSSARELSDDLGRFVRGEPVAARPVGRLERVAKWVRRNPTVAALSVVAALALVAGTVLSLLFGIEASRKADALEKQAIQLQEQTLAAQDQAIQLQEQTLAAQDNAQRAEQNEQEVRRVLLSGLLIPIGHNPHRITDLPDPVEADAMRQLRSAPAPLRVEFLEMALHNPETAGRVGHRADWVVQAIVGCDRGLRADVARLAARRSQEPNVPQEVKFACARLGLGVNLSDRAWAERSAEALLVELRDPLLVEPADYAPLAEALVAVSERLPPTQGADCAARALDFFLTRPRGPRNQPDLFQRTMEAVAAISPALDATAAARAAETLGTIIRHPDYDVNLWPSFCTALTAVCRRLPESDASAHINRTVDFLIATREPTAETDKYVYYRNKAWALGALCGRLDAGRSSHATRAILAILSEGPTIGGTKYEFILYPDILSSLSSVAERLDALEGRRAAEDLILVLRSYSGNLDRVIEELRAALVACCRRVNAAEAARVAEAIAVAVRDPKTLALVRSLFPDALAALVGGLAPDQAASLESVLVDSLLADLADAKSRPFRAVVGRALATASRIPGATDAARVAEALAAAIRDPQTRLEALKPLVAALAVVIGQLPLKDASSHVNRTVDGLDSLWGVRKTPYERATLAEALALLWSHLEPTAAAGCAKKVAADLEAALRDGKAAPHDIASLAIALSAVYNHIDPAERGERANALADLLVAALRKPRNDPRTISPLWDALSALCSHSDQLGAGRTADILLALLDDPAVQQFLYLSSEKTFKRIAVRLDERNLRRLLAHPLAVGPLQRTLLGVLSGSKNRTFGNTWDYLDSSESNENGTDGLSPRTNR
jgi:tRNA A-37 threonylcarbamoyl transferase component Bud32